MSTLLEARFARNDVEFKLSANIEAVPDSVQLHIVYCYNCQNLLPTKSLALAQTQLSPKLEPWLVNPPTHKLLGPYWAPLYLCQYAGP